MDARAHGGKAAYSMTPIVPDAVAQTDAHFFNDQQIATLRRLSEILMPPLKGYPGAKEAGTPEFLDFLIGVSPRDRQADVSIRSGPARCRGKAPLRHGVCNGGQEHKRINCSVPG